MAKVSYTYEDFIRQATQSGLLSRFSQADLKLAQENPAAGMSILSYKQDYEEATTDEGRALANAGAERVRSEYGGYTGGTDGSGYYVREDYENPYADEQQTLLDGIMQGNGFGDYADQAWQEYRKSYLREGRLAFDNALGSAAANTGGIASTAAVMAAQQAQNYYGAQAVDKKMELDSQLRDDALAALGVLNQMNQTEHDQYLSGEQLADDREQRQADREQQAFENAINIWKSYGYVTEDIAGVLGLPVGTPYSEQAYNEWYESFMEQKEGVYTGKVQKDVVNGGEEQSDGENPAAGDSPLNHGQISRGSTGRDVQAMQTYLIRLGYRCGDKGADGVFGSDTAAAVRAFQAEHGLRVDGICGPKTWAAIFAALEL